MEQEATAIDEDDEKNEELSIVDHIDSDEDCEQVERDEKTGEIDIDEL